MDFKYLLLLNYAIKNEEKLNRESISKILNLSNRHTIRKIKKWTDQGIINYVEGLGRGNISKIEFLKDIESEFLNYFFTNLNLFTSKEILEYLALPLSKVSLKLMNNALQSEIFSSSNSTPRVYVDYIYRIPHISDNIKLYDSNLQTIYNNISLRLFERQNTTFTSYIVSYFECVENKCTIYIYKDIQFSNGHILTAKDVVSSLNYFLDNKLKGLYRNYIFNLKVRSRYIFEFEYVGNFHMVQYILSELSAGIFKKIEGESLSVGPFFISEMNADYIVLKRNNYFSSYFFDIDLIYLINDMETYMKQKTYPNKVEMSTHCKYKFLMLSSKENFNDRMLEFIQDFYLYKEHKKLLFKDTAISIKITVPATIPQALIDLQTAFEKYNYRIIFNVISMDDYINYDINLDDADFIYMSEVLDKNMTSYDAYNNSIVTEWDIPYNDVKELIEKYFFNTSDDWKEISIRLEDEIIKNRWILPIDTTYHQWLLAEDYIFNSEMSYGVKNYSKFLFIGSYNA